MSGGEDRLLSATEAAEVMGCSRQTVHSMLKSGQLPCVMVGKRRKIPMARLYEQLGLQSGFEKEDDDGRHMA